MLLSFTHAKAQFDRKICINLGLGQTNATGDMEDYFSNGISFSPGIQINFTPRFSFLARINGYSLGSKEDGNSFDNINLGAGVKFKLLKNRRISPYLFFLSDLNFASYSFVGSSQYYSDYYDDYDESDIGIGVTPGAGLEIRLSDRIALFGQLSYNAFLLTNTEFFNATTNNVQAGLSISFLKSKEL